MRNQGQFTAALAKLNTAQREAVESIDGPVMVIAGPGTGKTQVLALRIAHILQETDTPASGILCLTFTNAGVHAMRERLLRLIGSVASQVHISTFHRFAIRLIEKHYPILGFEAVPELLSETEAVALADEILERGQWQYIRPRSDSARYFSDLKGAISLAKREGISPEEFLHEIERSIESLKNDPANISSRGSRKGELKKEVLTEIEGLLRTREAVGFFEEYEKEKRERLRMDYDDVLTYAVKIVQESEDACANLRENYLYVLVDEHQDSSGVQNAFLEAVWKSTEKPNLFVVGDDRQMIYGFSGASVEHFTNFRSAFGKAKEITLTENYRSTQTILDAADRLLLSNLAKGKLVSARKKKGQALKLLECEYPRDEIIFAAKEIQEKIAEGVPAEDIAVLVPKNYQVRNAIEALRDQGIAAAGSISTSFFPAAETATIRKILSVLADPYDNVNLASLLLDPALQIPPLEAHSFLRSVKMRSLSLESLIKQGTQKLSLDPIARLGTLLSSWLSCASSLGLHGLVQRIGEDLFFTDTSDHDSLVRQVEVVRTFIHLIASQMERNPETSISDFLAYLDRLEHYGHELPLAVFVASRGVRVLTLHGSKGLEFSHVHIAHLDESSLMKGKRNGFVLPERLREAKEEKNELTARRELYVAITRAKDTCSLSYSRHSYTGADMEAASILADLPEEFVVRKTAQEVEKEILDSDPKRYVSGAQRESSVAKEELTRIVAGEYASVTVSVTLLNNFFECPWKWYFRNLLQLPEAKSESLLLGSVVHTGIEYFLKHRGDEREEALSAALLDCLEKEYISDKALEKRILSEAKKILSQFQETYLPNISTQVLSERSLSYRDPKLPHLSIYGKIDMTEYVHDRLVTVTDFKTGGGKAKSVIEKRDEEGRMSSLLRQLAMYSYLIENAEKGTNVSASRLLFIEEDSAQNASKYETKITDAEISLLKKDIADYDELVSSGTWVERPCEAKLYGTGQSCQYCAKAQRLYAG